MMRLMPLLFISFLVGCARYEFEVLEPPEFATRVGRKTGTAADIRREPLDYHMRAYEGRLVMNIFNTDDQPIELLGDQSFVVDPEGESHPLLTATIAPNSYIKLILPPLRPYYRSEPRFGFGIGVGFSHYHGPYPHRYYRGPGFRHYFDPLMPAPMYLSAYDTGSPFWAWEGQSTVRLRLTYRRQNDELFHHEFVIQRVKV